MDANRNAARSQPCEQSMTLVKAWAASLHDDLPPVSLLCYPLIPAISCFGARSQYRFSPLLTE
jgi:hypothetical protein